MPKRKPPGSRRWKTNPPPKLDFLVISPVQGTTEYKNVRSVSCLMKGSGWLEIMPGHLPLIGATVEGVIRIASENGKSELTLPPGILQVGNNTVRLFVLGQDFQSGGKAGSTSRFAADILPAKTGREKEEG